jgi:hypothetical protein
MHGAVFETALEDEAHLRSPQGGYLPLAGPSSTPIVHGPPQAALSPRSSVYGTPSTHVLASFDMSSVAAGGAGAGTPHDHAPGPISVLPRPSPCFTLPSTPGRAAARHPAATSSPSPGRKCSRGPLRPSAAYAATAAPQSNHTQYASPVSSLQGNGREGSPVATQRPPCAPNVAAPPDVAALTQSSLGRAHEQSSRKRRADGRSSRDLPLPDFGDSSMVESPRERSISFQDATLAFGHISGGRSRWDSGSHLSSLNRSNADMRMPSGSFMSRSPSGGPTTTMNPVDRAISDAGSDRRTSWWTLEYLGSPNDGGSGTPLHPSPAAPCVPMRQPLCHPRRHKGSSPALRRLHSGDDLLPITSRASSGSTPDVFRLQGAATADSTIHGPCTPSRSDSMARGVTLDDTESPQLPEILEESRSRFTSPDADYRSCSSSPAPPVVYRSDRVGPLSRGATRTPVSQPGSQAGSIATPYHQGSLQLSSAASVPGQTGVVNEPVSPLSTPGGMRGLGQEPFTMTHMGLETFWNLTPRGPDLCEIPLSTGRKTPLRTRYGQLPVGESVAAAAAVNADNGSVALPMNDSSPPSPLKLALPASASSSNRSCPQGAMSASAGTAARILAADATTALLLALVLPAATVSAPARVGVSLIVMLAHGAARCLLRGPLRWWGAAAATAEAAAAAVAAAFVALQRRSPVYCATGGCATAVASLWMVAIAIAAVPGLRGTFALLAPALRRSIAPKVVVPTAQSPSPRERSANGGPAPRAPHQRRPRMRQHASQQRGLPLSRSFSPSLPTIPAEQPTSPPPTVTAPRPSTAARTLPTRPLIPSLALNTPSISDVSTGPNTGASASVVVNGDPMSSFNKSVSMSSNFLPFIPRRVSCRSSAEPSLYSSSALTIPDEADASGKCEMAHRAPDLVRHTCRLLLKVPHRC